MFHARRLAIALITAAAVALALAAFPMSYADAQAGVKAKVYLVQSRIPRTLSEKGLLGFARRSNRRKLEEDKSKPLKERFWKATMVTAFNKPVNDLEFQVLFYDITEARRFISPPMSVFINDRSQKTFVQDIRLKRPDFKPNRKMELVVVIRRKEVGKHRFEMLGEVPRNTGVVNF